MNMRNDELKEFYERILKTLQTEANGRRGSASFSAEMAHMGDGCSRAQWENLCVWNKRIACAYEQAAALIEAYVLGGNAK